MMEKTPELGATAKDSDSLRAEGVEFRCGVPVSAAADAELTVALAAILAAERQAHVDADRIIVY